MKRILFVCLGNICRSPLAEGIARKVIEERGLKVAVDSAGTSNWHEGEQPCEHSIKVACSHGIDISNQRSRPLAKEDLHIYDFIIAMDEQNKTDLENFGFDTVLKIGDFGGFKGADVPDPYFFPGFEGFEKVYAMIDLSVRDMFENISAL